jgi:hypothetical protein
LSRNGVFRKSFDASNKMAASPMIGVFDTRSSDS